MEGPSRSISALVLLMLVLLTIEIETMAEEEHRIYESKSSEYRGVCLLDANCDNICKAEPILTGGHCHGFFHNCYCTKPC
ncbi:hypothetical protein ES288_A01G045800v1 [Gossypium darwinii]|uniref:Knottins-like domain-containing protein n=1 Tax=Gossypium darwinii TaxID=34276 RepID=A0A5D2HHY9_GOSDA|nr:hypothetical protein ES288_A01G045800v1 [Gossypium darwinii]